MSRATRAARRCAMSFAVRDFPALEAGAVPGRDPFVRPSASSTATHYGLSFFSRSFANSLRPNLRATSSGKSVMTLSLAIRNLRLTEVLSGRQPLRSLLSAEGISSRYSHNNAMRATEPDDNLLYTVSGRHRPHHLQPAAGTQSHDVRDVGAAG